MLQPPFVVRVVLRCDDCKAMLFGVKSQQPLNAAQTFRALGAVLAAHASRPWAKEHRVRLEQESVDGSVTYGYQ